MQIQTRFFRTMRTRAKRPIMVMSARSILLLIVALLALMPTPSRAEDETKPTAGAQADPNAAAAQRGAEADREWMRKEIEFQQAAAAHFKAIIEPALNANCVECHVSGSVTVGGNLLFDMGPPNTWQGRSGRALIPGNPRNSLLLKSMRGDGMPLMPPDGRLPEEIIEEFAEWIRNGAIVPSQVPQTGWVPDTTPVQDPVMKLFDKDGDGVISDGERAGSGMALAGLDKNGDGRITADETAAAMPDNFFYGHAYSMYGQEPFTHTGVYDGWTGDWDTGFDRQDWGSRWGNRPRTWTDRNGKTWTTRGGSWSDPRRPRGSGQWSEQNERWSGRNSRGSSGSSGQTSACLDPGCTDPSHGHSSSGRGGRRMNSGNNDTSYPTGSSGSSLGSSERDTIRDLQEFQQGRISGGKGSGRRMTIRGGSK